MEIRGNFGKDYFLSTIPEPDTRLIINEILNGAVETRGTGNLIRVTSVYRPSVEPRILQSYIPAIFPKISLH